jgi:hypothetical protein
VNHSEQIAELVTALAKAQGEIVGAKKDSENPFFSSKYADLAACWDVCREPLSKNGLCIVQVPERGKPVTIEWETKNEKTGEVTSYKVDTEELVVVTTLFHSSGQWIRSELPMIPRDASPQGMGSALTYGRHYGLSAIIGIAQVDDDGNQASGRNPGLSQPHSPRGDLGKGIPQDKARSVALEMIAIISRPAADGDHDERQKALSALDYHDRVLVKDEDLYVAASGQMDAAKRNAWKALISAARNAQKADRDVQNAGRKF